MDNADSQDLAIRALRVNLESTKFQVPELGLDDKEVDVQEELSKSPTTQPPEASKMFDGIIVLKSVMLIHRS